MRKSNILFEHNRKAYESAVSMMEQTGKAAVIHPTGTGKSFIAFQLCADQKGKKVCWLSPSEYIFKTQKEKWCSAGGDKPENVEFITYARLMRMKKDELADIRPDYIILDEFHRCGAVQWGGGVERLREMYPDAFVLGLSATNIRYLDNQRDMAWELFGGNIASELTLGAAIVQGILPAPKYVLSVYSYRRELKKYEARVRQAKNPAVRDAAERELEALRRALEKADGLEKVFARHMTAENSGKYIVFCASYEHLSEMRELATEWFAKVDPNPHIYTAYSDDPAAAEEFQAFKVDKSKHLKLLYCIDMLNEGIHVDDIDGVILLRPTVSPTIYKQQIGRALAAGGKNTPVIFDIVMNIENLCSIGVIEEELRQAVLSCYARGQAKEIVKEHFQIIDEVEDCRKLFMQLSETLGASWNAMYAMAKEYYATHGNLEVPTRYVTVSGYSLGAWLNTQRKVYTGRTAGNLSTEQIKRLNAIGMVWEDKSNASWEKSYIAACEYFRENGNLEVPAAYMTADGLRLGRWIRRQREVYQEVMQKKKAEDADKVTKEGQEKDEMDERGRRSSKREERYVRRIEKLDKIGMVWENDDPWEKRFALAKKYFEKHGNLKMPADYVTEGVWLERWLREQKARLVKEETAKDIGKCQKNAVADEKLENGLKGKKFLTAQQKKKLHSIGLYPGASQAELSWQQQYGEAQKFYREHGNLSVPKRYAARNGKNLGVWLQRQRTEHRRGELAGWQVQMLDGIGMVWELEDPWEAGFWHAREYFSVNGDLAVPNNYICADGYRLGRWISNQRCAYGGSAKKGLREERVRELEAIGMVWSAKPGRRRKRELRKNIAEL